MKKGFTFTTEDIVKHKREEMEKEIEEETEVKEEVGKIEITARQKAFIIVFLAVAFFLGLYLVMEEIAVPLFFVILVHECGHLIALKYFHMKIHGLFFIPFIGGGVLPKEDFPSPGVEAAVALAGPAMGLSWNVVAFVAVKTQFPFEDVLRITVVNMVLNLFNLLPILPLDGGRIVRAALLRGRKSLVPVTMITIGSGVAVAFFFKDVVILIITMVGLGSLIHNYRRIKSEVNPSSWWKSALILGTWAGIILLYFYFLPRVVRTFLKIFIFPILRVPFLFSLSFLPFLNTFY